MLQVHGSVVLEQEPFVGQILLQVQGEVQSRLAKLLLDGVQPVLQRSLRQAPQRRAALPCGVLHVQDHVRDGAVVELPHLLGKLEPPGRLPRRSPRKADTLVLEIQFEHAVVVLGVAGCDRLDGPDVVDETLVVAGVLEVSGGGAVVGIRVLAIPVAHQRKLGAHRRIGPDDAGQADRHRLHPSEVVPRMVHVVQDLRHLEVGRSGCPESYQRQRVQLRQGDVLGDLVFPLVLFQVAGLHALDVVDQTVGALQALLHAVPVSVRDERIVVAQLESIAALRLLGELVSQLVGLEIHGADLPDHPVVQLLVGELGAHELGVFLRVLDLQFVVLQIGFRFALSDLGGDDLLVDLGHFPLGQAFLQFPVVETTVVAPQYGRAVGFVRRRRGEHIEHPGCRGGGVRQERTSPLRGGVRTAAEARGADGEIGDQRQDAGCGLNDLRRHLVVVRLAQLVEVQLLLGDDLLDARVVPVLLFDGGLGSFQHLDLLLRLLDVEQPSCPSSS